MEKSVLSATLVGRSEELEAMRSLLKHESSRQGQIVLVMGEAGVGKTRLIAKVRKLAVRLNSHREAAPPTA